MTLKDGNAFTNSIKGNEKDIVNIFRFIYLFFVNYYKNRKFKLMN